LAGLQTRDIGFLLRKPDLTLRPATTLVNQDIP